MIYLQKYLTNFQKLFFGRTMRKVAIVVENFNCTDVLGLQLQRYNFSNIWKMYKFQFFPLHCPSRNAISSKVFNEFSKTFHWLKDDEGGYCVWKFQVHRYFGFAIGALKLSKHPENVKISIFPLHCPGRNAISSKVFSEFSKTFFWPNDEEGGYCAWKFQLHRYFGFAKATLQIFEHPENEKFLFFPLTLSQQKCYIFKII